MEEVLEEEEEDLDMTSFLQKPGVIHFKKVDKLGGKLVHNLAAVSQNVVPTATPTQQSQYFSGKMALNVIQQPTIQFTSPVQNSQSLSAKISVVPPAAAPTIAFSAPTQSS